MRSGTVLRLLLISLIVFVAAGIARDRLSPANWSVPLQYEGDSLLILGWIQAASEFDYLPFASKINHRLGAPYAANWNDCAMYEEITTFAMGLIAKCTNLMVATNAGMIVLSYLLSVLAFYACCRMLRYSRPWSFAAAILFGFTFYNTRRHIFNLMLSFSYVIPLGIVACWLMLAGKRLRFGSKWFWFCVVISFLMGLSNPYSLNIFLQLFCFSIALSWWRTRDTARLKTGLLCIAAAAAGFLSVNLDTLSYAHAHGSNPAAIPRNYAQTERAALKPMELFVPPGNHNLDALSAIGRKYESLALVKGELFSPYLGIIGIAGLLWMTAEFLWAIMGRRRKQRVPAHVPQCAWILAYSVIGGVNNLFALAGLYLFRSANRYSMFISALCLFFLAARMSRLTRLWSPPACWALALGLMLVGLFDQLPQPLGHAETMRVANMVENDRTFCQTMEAALPEGGMVFQLPVMRFPEGGPVGAVQEYEMLRPYFATKTLRFSFGSNQGRPRDDWQFAVEKLPPAEMVAALERFGFCAIYLNRRGFSDRGDALLKALATLGKTKVAEDSQREQVCIALSPSSHPQLPHSDQNALVNYKRGWIGQEHAGDQVWHWSDGNATLTFFNEGRGQASFRITAAVASLSARRVEIEFGGRKIWNAELAAGQGAPVDVWVEATHGNNSLHFITDVPAVQPDPNAPVRLTFAVVNLRATKAER